MPSFVVLMTEIGTYFNGGEARLRLQCSVRGSLPGYLGAGSESLLLSACASLLLLRCCAALL